MVLKGVFYQYQMIKGSRSNSSNQASVFTVLFQSVVIYKVHVNFGKSSSVFFHRRIEEMKGINKKMLQHIIYLTAFPWVSDVATLKKLSGFPKLLCDWSASKIACPAGS